MFRSLLLISLYLTTFLVKSQNVDSLWKVVNDAKNHDTIRLATLYDLAWVFVYDNPDSTYTIAEMQRELAQQTKNKKWEAKAYNAMGAALQIRSAYPKAVEHYQKGMKIFEQLGDKSNMAGALGNIGSIYIELQKFDVALDYQLKCLKLVQEMGNLEGVASSLNNTCVIYTNMKQFDKALFYGEQAVEMYEHLKDYHGQASGYLNLGSVYSDMNKYSEAILNLNKALKIAVTNEITTLVTKCKLDLAAVYLKTEDWLKVIVLASQAEREAKEQEDLDSHLAAVKYLASAYNKKQNHKEAYKYGSLTMELTDSLNKMKNESEIARMEAQFHYEKKAEADSLRNAEQQSMKDALIFAKEAQIEKDRIQKIALYGGILLMLISGGVMYNRFRFIQKQKNIIEAKNKETEEQKIIIEEKQKEILSSISYAKRLQEAILPPRHEIAQHLPDSFILYKPKDIVAGDFYWMEALKGKVMIAAADCTGHGVPGAMVSVVCSNALNRAVNEFSISEPGKVLDKTRELVVETFERSETDVKDGMDISLCLFDLKNKSLQWAGANNPLWIVRKGEILQFKPDKQAIGKVDNPSGYTTHNIALEINDCVYIFTDGYADQFGGPSGKKFKYHQLVELMKSISVLPLQQQQAKLEEEFNNWKGPLEQVDDICVIGIKI